MLATITHSCELFFDRTDMALTVRNQTVKRLPNGGKVHAILRCVRCGHTKSFHQEIGDEYVQRLRDRAVCSKCRSKEITLDLFSLETQRVPTLDLQSARKCIVCGLEIAEITLEAVPHTLCCSEHLNQNPPARPRVVEPMGSREDFKKDSASNWSRATRPKF
jgi:hypothetical protein